MSRGVLAAVILAAGASTRMGRPKALIEWRGRPFVLHAIGLAKAARCTPIVVVEGAVALPEPATAGARCVVNPGWARGQMSSVQVGLRAVDGAEGILLLTVDRPHIQPDTVATLAMVWRDEPTSIVQPSVDGVRGHPLLVPADVAQRFVDAGPEQTQRDVLAAPELAVRRRSVSCEDAAVLQNLDRPEDLEALPVL